MVVVNKTQIFTADLNREITHTLGSVIPVVCVKTGKDI